MLVPEVTGADNPVVAILNLKHRETSEAHRRARVVEQIVPFRLDAGNRGEAKPVVVQQRALERREPVGNPGTLASEIFANDLDHAVDTKLVLRRETSGHLLPKSERQQRNRDQHDGGKGEEQASTQAHLLSRIVRPGDNQSSIPVRSHTGPPAPHNRLQPRLDQRDDGLGIEPWSVIYQGLQVSARVNRPAVDGHHVTTVGSPPLCPCQGLTGQPGGTLVCGGGPEGAHRDVPAASHKRSARSRAAASLASYTIRGVGEEWSRGGERATSQSGIVCHQNGPRAPRASPRTASSARTCRASSDSEAAERGAAGCKEQVGSLPCQRHGMKLRQRGCIVERRGIPCEQQVNTLVQEIPRVAGSDREIEWPADCLERG